VIGDVAKMVGYPIGLLRRRLAPGLAAAVKRYWSEPG
jgi:hypothetical protein